MLSGDVPPNIFRVPPYTGPVVVISAVVGAVVCVGAVEVGAVEEDGADEEVGAVEEVVVSGSPHAMTSMQAMIHSTTPK